MSVTVNGSSGLTFNDGSTQNTSPFTGGLGFRNRIINGDFRIDQRNAGASVTQSDVANVFPVDRFKINGSQNAKFTAQQNSGSVTPPAGFTNYLGCVSSSAYSVGSSDYFILTHNVEGNNVADLGWGTANAATVTLSFWVRSSLTGTFGGCVANSNFNRSYPFTYTITAANTWEQKSITIAGDTTGTWFTNNGIGLNIQFGLGVGSTYSGTAGAWAAAGYISATGATSLVGTNGATFYITGVQLEKGSTATSFDYRPYGVEDMLCKRYYYKLSGGGNTRHAVAGNGSLSQGFPTVFLKTSMRTIPTFSYSSLSDFVVEGITGGGQATTTGLSLNAGTTETITINCTSSGSGTGTGINLLGSGSGAWTAYSAEL